MANLTQKYLDKELVDSIPEKLPPDYDQWLITQEPTMPELEPMAKSMLAFDRAVERIFGIKPF